MMIVSGIAVWFGNRHYEKVSLSGLPDGFTVLNGKGALWFLPVVIAAGIFLYCHWLLTRTLFGRRIYSVGVNPRTSEISGIPVKKIVFSLSLISGVMNIEEDYIPDAIHTAGKYLAHFHVGENNRKLPFDGPGSLDWRAIGKALRDVNYNGYVIAEPFVTTGGQIAKDIKVWRDLSGNADEAGLDRAAGAYGKFIRSAFEG